ncbi:hypothetical protein FF38_07860 [Lucilia cuprina]|uniref:Uncharacterized protein n=1 Tax=Lucilia cuprina TaxID=7375 RepID=A0A0L0BXW0_LUCCU|nr:hypothetical protein FF38_07860 [Lucilia cuprina]
MNKNVYSKFTTTIRTIGLFNISTKGFDTRLASALKIPTFGYGFYGGNNRSNRGDRKVKGRTFKQIARIANPHQYSKRNKPYPGQPFHPQGKP